MRCPVCSNWTCTCPDGAWRDAVGPAFGSAPASTATTTERRTDHYSISDVEARVANWLARGNPTGGMNLPSFDGATPSIRDDIHALVASHARLREALTSEEQFAKNAKKSPSLARKLRTAVVLHLAADGTPTLKVWDPAGEILALWIDESAQGDRVYEQIHRETDISTLRALIGPDRIGNSADGYLDDQTVQAIRAAFWRRDGGQLAEVEATDGA